MRSLLLAVLIGLALTIEPSPAWSRQPVEATSSSGAACRSGLPAGHSQPAGVQTGLDQRRPSDHDRRHPSDHERTVVRVFVHVLRTTSRGGVSPARVRLQLRVLNRAYAGQQSPLAAVAPFHFHLAGVDVTTNRGWYRMGPGTVAERRAKRALRQGGPAALNLYIGANEASLLGWTTQPTAYAGEPFMDGVVIAQHTLPGGRRGRYSAGDAAVHESGHWFGLFHTFAGGCGQRGDFVADTPAEARPSFDCPVGRDTCSAPRNDPVHNFMDYGTDRCMDRFSTGQVRRMTQLWTAYRQVGRA